MLMTQNKYIFLKLEIINFNKFQYQTKIFHLTNYILTVITGVSITITLVNFINIIIEIYLTFTTIFITHFILRLEVVKNTLT